MVIQNSKWGVGTTWTGSGEILALTSTQLRSGGAEGEIECCLSIKGYTVKSGYDFLKEGHHRNIGASVRGVAFNSLWLSRIAYKVKAFRWKTFLNRLLTNDQLFRRGVLSSSLGAMFSGGEKCGAFIF